MGDNYGITGEYAGFLHAGVTKALEQEFSNPEPQDRDIERGMYVRLTDEGDRAIPADFGEPFPYKAERIVYDKNTRTIVADNDPLTFDPDSPTDLANLQLYVYEVNGTPGLTGGVYWIELQAFKFGTGDMYWSFSVKGDMEFARINSEISGEYEAQQLDENLTATGRVYNGVEYPLLLPLNIRQKVPIGTIVQVLKKRDKAYFYWKDPILELGDASSPAELNGTFLPFAEKGGTSGPSTANFDPNDGIFKFIRLHAIGQDVTGSGGGQPTGLKITPIDEFNYQIELVDEGGNPIDPTTPISPNPNNRTYCTEAVFDAQRRVLTLTTKDDLGAVICTKQVNIPCCPPGGGLGGGGGGGGGVDPDPSSPGEDTSHNYPTDSPENPNGDPNTVYVDPDAPPSVLCDESQPLTYPVPADTAVARLSIDVGRAMGNFNLTLQSVTNPDGADVSVAFSIEGILLSYNGAEDLPAGLYQYSVLVSNTGATDWQDFLIVCYFEVIEVECFDDQVSTHDGVTDNCPVPCSSVSIQEHPMGMAVVNKTRSATSDDIAQITVQMDLWWQSYMKSGKFRPQLQDDEKGQKTKVSNTYTYKKHATFNKSFSVPADQNWREVISVPVATPNRNNPLNRVANGRLELRYKSWPGFRNPQFLCKFIDAGGLTYAASIATPKQDGVLSYDDTKHAHGYIRTSLNILKVDDQILDGDADLVGKVQILDPCENDDWEFSITGGVDANLFRLEHIDGNMECSLHVKPGVTTNKSSYLVTVSAQSVTANCIKDIDLNISSRKKVANILADNAIANGRAGQPVATLCAVDDVAGRIPDGGQQINSWSITNIVEPAGQVAMDKEYFQIEPELGGDAVLRSRVDLPAGNYDVTVQVQNDQMLAESEVYEKSFTFTVTKTVDYTPTSLKGLA